MSRTLRTALTALLLIGLVAGGAGAAAAGECDVNNDVDNTVVVNDDDVVDVDDSLNNISTNVLGVQVDDSVIALL
jgi:hypothetical protein